VDIDLRDRWLTHAIGRMTAAGLRSGAARTAVVELLARDAHCLLSATEITDKLRLQHTGSAASVYRVIDELFELGLLHRLDGRDGIARYEIADPDHHHHHFIDEQTGTVDAFSDEELERTINAVADRLGIKLTSHEVVLRGVRHINRHPSESPESNNTV
jgi:Fur family transcriptional regulator, ferric uptake regulator